MPQINTIAARWAEMEGRAGPGTSAESRRAMRFSFYCGCRALWEILGEAPDDLAEREALLTVVGDEIHHYLATASREARVMMEGDPRPSLHRSPASWADLDPNAAAHANTKAQIAVLLEQAKADIASLAALVAAKP